jgi:hypothetical protein
MSEKYLLTGQARKFEVLNNYHFYFRSNFSFFTDTCVESNVKRHQELDHL